MPQGSKFRKQVVKRKTNHRREAYYSTFSPLMMWWVCDPCPWWHNLPLIDRLIHDDLP